MHCPSGRATYNDTIGDSVLQQDNAPVHTASVVTEWLEQHSIQVDEQPPYSPGLNPIEHASAYLWAISLLRTTRRVAERKSQAKGDWISNRYHVRTGGRHRSLRGRNIYTRSKLLQESGGPVLPAPLRTHFDRVMPV